jgi:hypothetical protein
MHRATLIVYLALAAVAAIAAAAASNDEPAPDSVVTETGGSFSLANSREGMPVFTATNLGPGDSAKGTVEIANEGSEAIVVTLSQRNLTDVPGTSGGVLSQRLALKVKDLSSPSPVYEGPLASMQPRSLGRLAPGASRSYEFIATLPASGPASASDNAVQGASTSVAYSWTAGEAPSAPEAPSASTGSSPTTTGSSSPTSPSPLSPHLSVRIVDYRNTLRNDRLIVWVHCNQACRIGSRARLLGVGRGSDLRPTARHAQRRRFGARTRRISLPVPPERRDLLSAADQRVRIFVIARNRQGERATTSKLMNLRGAHR